jgi:hypothetical protein
MTLGHKKINGHTFIFHLLLSQYFAINNYQSNKREKLMKAPNYSAAQVAQIIDQYQAGQDIDMIADGIGKSVRSVRSKLVREGVYVAKPKAKSNKVLGPTKKELLKDLEKTGVDVAGLEGATKEAITRLLAHFTN